MTFNGSAEDSTRVVVLMRRFPCFCLREAWLAGFGPAGLNLRLGAWHFETDQGATA
jgi:hypothetical protein